jgi:3-mercaptopyruvate sulfurtransferase SseA
MELPVPARKAAIGRDLLLVLAVMALSAGIAVAANLCWHKMDWLSQREIMKDPPPTSQRAGLASSTGLTADDVLAHVHEGTARFVDAREPKEYAEGHLSGAINLPSSEVYAQIGNVTSMIAPSEKVIVYCGGKDCEASHVVADILRREFMFTDVQVYEKGWAEISTSSKFLDCISSGDQP